MNLEVNANAKARQSWAKRLSTFGIGFSIKKLLDYGFDYGLYPIALLSFGTFAGGVLMTIASIGLNIAVIRAYDWAKKDFLLLETFKEMKQQDAKGLVARQISKALRAGDAPAFFVLSWIEDPIVTTLYLRRGAHQYDGLSRRDWVIFFSSTVVSNLMWIFSLVSVFEIVKFVAGLLG